MHALVAYLGLGSHTADGGLVEDASPSANLQRFESGMDGKESATHLRGGLSGREDVLCRV